MDTLQIYNERIKEKKIILNYIINQRIILNQTNAEKELIIYFKNEHQKISIEIDKLYNKLKEIISSL